MSVNRIANLLKRVAAEEGTASVGQGFMVNPFVAQFSPCWQTHLYQAAFLQAQKAVAEEEEWPMAEWWN
jgi:hypothetical protein